MVDQIVTDVKSVGADVVSEKNKVVQFIKDRWPHFVTWLALGWSTLTAVVKHFL